MTTFHEIDRPAKNRRHLDDADMEWDRDLEAALLATRNTGKAITVKLSHFHSSPAKGRLWKQGFRVAHRVLPDRETVAAWVVGDNESAPVPGHSQT